MLQVDAPVKNTGKAGYNSREQGEAKMETGLLVG